MEHVTKEQLDCIAVALAKNDKNLYTKTDVNRAIVAALSKRVGLNCSHGYIANLRNGVQLDKTSVMLKAKVDQLHTMLCKPPKAKPLPHEDGWHIVRVYGKKIDVDRYTDAIPAKKRLGVMLKEIGNE